MADNFLENLYPMPPNMGPPFPQFLQIFWPWYKKEPTVYKCPYCEATFATQEELSAHIAKYHGTPPLTYGCPYCDQSFATLKELIDHVATAHPDKPPMEAITIAWE